MSALLWAPRAWINNRWATAVTLRADAQGRWVDVLADTSCPADAEVLSDTVMPAMINAHSIKSELPWLFEGQLPHISIGTANGESCAPELCDDVMRVFASQTEFTHVLNARFKGGHITRHFGTPGEGIHAIQLEMCWRAYMDETLPYRWRDVRAARVAPLLRAFLETLLTWTP